MKKRFWLLYFLLAPVSFNAQIWLQPETFSVRQGLSQVFVPVLLQDSDGFIWAGTKNGLNRYDGRSFKVFKHFPGDDGSLSPNNIMALHETGVFLLVGYSGGSVLDFFNRKTHRTLHLPLEAAGVGKIPYVQQVFTDALGNIWLLAGAEQNLKLYKADLPLGFWERLPSDANLLKGLIFKKMHAEQVFSVALATDSKTLFVDAADGFFSFDMANGESRRYGTAKAYPHIPFAFRSRLRTDPKGGVWLAWNNSLQYFDGQNFYEFPISIKIESFLGVSKDGDLMFWGDKQLHFIPSESLKAAGSLTATLGKRRLSLASNPICALDDQSGLLWLGTNGQGIMKIRTGTKTQLQYFFEGQSIYGSIFEENTGAIGYFGPNGLRVFPENGDGPVIQIARRATVNNPGLWRLANDPQGNRWLFATLKPTRPVLFKISADGRTESFEIPVPEVGIRQGNLNIDPSDGSVWLAWAGVLLRFDPATRSWQQFSFADILPFNEEVFAVQPMRDGTVWIGMTQGLLAAKPDGRGGRTFKLYQYEAGNPNSIRHNSVSTLLLDADNPNVLWLGTKGGGISRFDTRNGQFSHHHTRNGLPDDTIYGLLWSGLSSPQKSASGLESPLYLWASCNKGIIRLNPKTGEVRNFTEANGLQSDEFNTWAFAKGANDKLLFGGINGLNVFAPDDFSDNPHLPPVFITELKVNNFPLTPGDSTGILSLAPEFSKRIELQSGQRNLSLEFAALEFTAPLKNRFRWILEGAETNWHPETEQNNASYHNLAPGRYTFKVMAANADGVWNPQAAVLEITVLPPWWRSWWAYLFYVVAALAAGRAFFKFQTKRRLEQTENRMLRELDTFKSRLFVNITHEFRTPLTVILGNLETEKLEVEQLVKSGEAGPFFNFLNRLTTKNEASKRNAENLLRLINQMLDLAKLEDKSLRLNLRRGDVVAFLKYVLESFQSLANARNLVLRFRSPLQNFDMDFDPDRLAQIVNNLISNALKHTPPGGAISLTVNAPAGDRLEIEVRDTGIGIPAADLPRIFERFYQAENAVGGTGIGLALTHELVKLFGGEIRVESRTAGEGRGAVFTLWLPVTRQAEPLEAAALGEFAADQTGVLGYENPLEVSEDQHFAQSDGLKPELLLVEDNADVVDFLRSLLESAYRVRVAYNGRAGMETAFETVPDVVVSDLMMPEMDGLQLCQALKNDARTSHIPVVLLTARAAVEDRVAGLARGADAYLVKPVNRAELVATLAALVELRKKLRERYATVPVPPPQTDDPDMQIEDVFLQKLRGAVEVRLSDADLSVEEICRFMGMSHPVIHRKVTALTGRPLMLFVRSVRLGHAREMLKNAPEKTISEIAYAVGFNDPKYFSRVFSEEFGLSPTAFREPRTFQSG